MGGVRDLSGYVCCHCPDVCEAFFKMKEWEGTMKYAVWTRSEWATNKEWREIEMKKRLQNFFFFFFLPWYHTIGDRTTEMLHCCQDLHRFILLKQNKNVVLCLMCPKYFSIWRSVVRLHCLNTLKTDLSLSY
jgi:hypothetical protein